jgi:hypothetical protein
MRGRSLVPVLLWACLAPACASSPSVDVAFEADWVEDFERDAPEEAAEAAEQAELDTLDDADDVEVLEDAPWDASEAPFATALPRSTKTQPTALTKGGAPRPKHGPISIFEDGSWFAHPTHDVDAVQARIAEAKALGAQVVRVEIRWAAVAPSPRSARRPAGFVASNPSGYDLRAIDAQIRAARNNGLKVLLTLSAGDLPYWASDDPAECQRRVAAGDAKTCAYQPSPKEFARFVTAIGRWTKTQGHRVWGWTFAHPPSPDALVATDADAMAEAFRYRRLWFAARKHLRKTAGVKARTFYGDLAANPNAPGEKLSPASPRWNLVPWSMCLSTGANPGVLDGSYGCPERPRKVEAQGVAFHAYGASPSAVWQSITSLEKLLDAAAKAGRIGAARPVYLTESGFATAKSGGVAASPAQQALFLNQTEQVLSDDPRVRSVAQLRLVDEGDGAWETGLRFALGDVVRTDGSVVSGDLLEVVPGSHALVRTGAPLPARVAWGAIDRVVRAGAGPEKPAYAAYRIAVSAYRSAGKVELWGHARADTGAGFSVEGFVPKAGGGGDWLEVATVKTDAFGYGRASLDVGPVTAWRLRFGGELSRVTEANDPMPTASPASALNGADGVVGPELFGLNAMGTTGSGAGLASPSGTKLPDQTFGSIRWWDDALGLGTLWCELQASPFDDLEGRMRERLDPKLDAAAAQGVQRIVMVVGHPASWVYDAGTKTGGKWFCGGQPSAIALPSPTYLGTSAAPGPGWVRFSDYVSKLLAHVNAKYAGKLPFELALQTWNEPTADSLSVKTGLPNTADDVRDAVAALVRYDTIVRYHLDTLPGLDTAHFKLLLSPLTRYSTGGVPHEYLTQAAAAHAAGRYRHYQGVYDGVSVHTYSEQGTAARVSADALILQYDAERLPKIFGGLSRFPRLRTLPVFQTETNHGVAYTDAARAFNPGYSDADRSKLAARLMVSALRWELEGQFVYGLNADGHQYPLPLEAAPTALKTDDVVLNTVVAVRGWIVGRKLEGCAPVDGVQDCVVRPPPFSAAEHIVFADKTTRATYVVPEGVKTMTAADGSAPVAVTPGAVVAVTLAPVLFR